MTRKSIAGSLILALAVTAGLPGLLSLTSSLRSAGDPRGGNPPNVVLIIIDTLRADLLGCYGFPGTVSPGVGGRLQRRSSPEIDEIAQKGVLFENVISQCSWTRPSIASMVSSLYPRTLGMYKEQFDVLAEQYLTLAEILRSNGYGTLGITANPHLNKAFNFHQGFDHYIETKKSWKEIEAGKQKSRRGSEAHLPTCLEVFSRVLAAAERAESMGEGPGYVQINIMEVHTTSLVRNKYRYIFDSFPVEIDESYSSKKKAVLKHLVRRTYAAVGQVSHDTSNFIDQLTSLPGWENTLFVITSDHGQGLLDHPNVEQSTLHGNLLYESQVHVPLIFYNPTDSVRLCRGKRVEDRVRLLDLVPTVLDYVGIQPPRDFQGRSVLALATGVGEVPKLPGVFVTETNWRNVEKIAVYGDEWKYIENRDEWEGVNPFELQRVGVKENGKLTDVVEIHGDDAEGLREFLRWWEAEYPRAESTQPSEDPSDEELKQLRSLGYIK
jgi:arylsulfatase A-like enzyme